VGAEAGVIYTVFANIPPMLLLFKRCNDNVADTVSAFQSQAAAITGVMI